MLTAGQKGKKRQTQGKVNRKDEWKQIVIKVIMTNEKTILKYQEDQSQWEEKGRTNSLESKKGQGKQHMGVGVKMEFKQAKLKEGV